MLEDSLIIAKNKTIIISWKKITITSQIFLDEKKVSKQLRESIQDSLFNSTSHSEGVVIVGSCKISPIGIDIEKIQFVDQSLINLIFHKATLNNNKPIIVDQLNFFKYWTISEAFFKLTQFKKINHISILSNKNVLINGKLYFYKTITIREYFVSIVSYTDFDLNFHFEVSNDN